MSDSCIAFMNPLAMPTRAIELIYSKACTLSYTPLIISTTAISGETQYINL